MDYKFNKTILVLIFFVFVVPLFVIVFVKYSKPVSNNVACTMEAKMCPDGSYVGREGPNCEFAECPKEVDVVKESNTAKISEKILSNTVFITPLKVVSDSRCPKDVQCIWEGTLIVTVRLEKNTILQEANLEIGEPFLFSGKNVALEGALPVKVENKPVQLSEYEFTFSVRNP